MSAWIAGVDEAGRGPLAGPVVVAAVILDPARGFAGLEGLDDSKKLTAKRREALYPEIIARAVAWRVEFVDVDEIDSINILQATLVGMERAVRALAPAAVEVLVDGNRLPRNLPCPGRTVIGGDAIEPSIMAASILAKVSRDRWMTSLHAEYPAYGFDRHKGYASAEHRAALQAHGPCPQHRRSFLPVQLALGL